MNRYRWKQKWKNMYAHERAAVVKAMGVTSEKGIALLCNKQYEDLDPSMQDSMKQLNMEDIVKGLYILSDEQAARLYTKPTMQISKSEHRLIEPWK